MSDYPHRARDLAGVSLRDLTTRHVELLDLTVCVRLRGETVVDGQALERLAVSEAISRYVNNGRQVDILAALNAGASWPTSQMCWMQRRLSSARSSDGGSAASGSSTTCCSWRGRDRIHSA